MYKVRTRPLQGVVEREVFIGGTKESTTIGRRVMCPREMWEEEERKKEG